MQKMFLKLVLICLWRLTGGFNISVKEGDSVTLSSGLTELKEDDLIQWRFEDENTLIAEINKQTNRFTVYDDVLEEIFKDSLKLNNNTGDLNITNTQLDHEGNYEVLINQRSSRFYLTVDLPDEEEKEQEDKIQMLKGDSVTLRSGLTELKDDDLIQWRFGDENTLIAEINKQTNSFTVYDDVLDGRFRDRLKLNNNTGDLTITDTTIECVGRYKVQTNNEISSIEVAVWERKVIVMKIGDSVTLSSGLTELKDDGLIQWRFGDEQHTIIAEINRQNNSFTVYDDALDGRFRNRLKLDKTGDLTIIDTNSEDTGVYFSRTGYQDFFFFLRVCDEEISVMEGGSATLSSGITEMKDYHNIWWMFKNENKGRIIRPHSDHAHDVSDRRFRDTMNLDNQTGSLILTNITTEHAGVYKVWRKNMGKRCLQLIVYAGLPVPVIIRDSSQCSSYCSVVCSVVNVSAVSLSWYKESRLLSSISVSDLSISLSLPLEVEYQENNTYSCVINNTISNLTTHLDINTLCQSCSGSVHCCGSTEAMIRLVLSALVGVATVMIVVYDIRSRRA